MTLQQFLQEQATREDLVGAKASQVRDEWKAAVARLIDTIEKWLRDADSPGVLTVERETHRIREERIGTYEVPGLMVRLGAREVRVIPLARYTIGSMVGDPLGAKLRFGRVDVTHGARKSMFYRSAEGDDWIIIDDSTYQPRPFDQANVETVFLNLLQ